MQLGQFGGPVSIAGARQRPTNLTRTRAALLLTSLLALLAFPSAGSAAPIVPEESAFEIRSAVSVPAITADGSIWLTERRGGDTTVSRFVPGSPLPLVVAHLPESSQCTSDFPSGSTVDSLNTYWVACGSYVTKVTSSGAITQFNLRNNELGQMVVGHDGDIWISWGKWDLARIRTSGAIDYYRVVDAGCPGFDLTVATDGKIWFREIERSTVGNVDPVTGTVTTVFEGADGVSLAAAPDGSVWTSDTQDSTKADLLRFNPDGSMERFPVKKPAQTDGELLVTPDGSVWLFAENVSLFSREPAWSGENGLTKTKKGRGLYQPGGSAVRRAPDGSAEVLALGTAANLVHPMLAPDGSVWGMQFPLCASDTLGWIKSGRYGLALGFLTRVSPIDGSSTSSTRGRREARAAIGCSASTKSSFGTLRRAKIASSKVKKGGRLRFRLLAKPNSKSSPSQLRTTVSWEGPRGTSERTAFAWTDRDSTSPAPKVAGRYVVRVKVLGKTFGRRTVTVR